MPQRGVERRLAAILSADVVGYSRLMGDDEAGTLGRLKAHRAEFMDPTIAAHGGRIVKLMGDGALIEFASVVAAVDCAAEIQRGMFERNAGEPEAQRIEFRIGVNLGDVIVDGDDIYGDGVNVAARLQEIAEPGGVCISGDAYRQVKGKTDTRFEDLGAREVKNIAEPVHVYRLTTTATSLAPAEPLALPDKPSIAVLPFVNMSGDAEQEYFSDGITEDIITELARFGELFVIARNSSFSYKGKSVKVQDIGRDLGVAYIVEGSVRKAGNRVRVTAQLVEAETGNHVWAERYDRDLEDIFAVQDEITRAIVSILPVRLRGALTESALRKPTQNLTAYDYYLRGRSVYMQSVGQDRSAVELFAKAVEIDPRCAHAYAFMALDYAYSVYGVRPLDEDPFSPARANIDRALAVAEDDSFVHAIAADVHMICGDHDLARSHAERAVAINPNDIWVRHSYGFVLAYSGEPEKAKPWLVETLRLDPRPPDFLIEILAECHYLLREYDAVIEIYTRWQNPPLHMYTQLAAAYAQLGRMDEARAAFETYRRLRPPDADFAYYLAAHVRLCKRQEDADHWVEGYRKAGLVD